MMFPPETKSGAARICLVADQPNWAFDNIAKQVQSRIGDDYAVEILHVTSFRDRESLFRALFLRDTPFDLVHFLWRGVLLEFFSHPVLARTVDGLSGIEAETLLCRMGDTAITTAVYDHMYLEPAGNARVLLHILSLHTDYSVSSNLLADLYTRNPNVPDPGAVLSDGVDLARFSRPNPPSAAASGRPLRIGWAGNSAWGEEGRDHKGLHTVILPAIRELQTRGHNVEAAVRDRRLSFVAHGDMPDFYRSLDVYVCASLNEGTPNPVLEAMASGVPVLSTRVGIVPDAFGPLQRDFMVEDRNSPEFLEKLARLVSDPDLRRRLSLENLESIQAWHWRDKMPAWREFFQRALSKAAGAEERHRRASLLHLMLNASRQHLQTEALLTESQLHYANLLWHRDQLQRELNTRPHRMAAVTRRVFDRCAHGLRGRTASRRPRTRPG